MRIKIDIYFFIIIFSVLFFLYNVIYKGFISESNAAQVTYGDFRHQMPNNSVMVVYSYEKCGACIRLEQYLNYKKINFVKKPFEKYKKEMEAMKINTVPFIITETWTMKGFDESKLNSLIFNISNNKNHTELIPIP